MNHIRHGDVLLTRIDSLPDGKVIDHKGQHVLAWGEVTGHAHRLTVQNNNEMKVIQKDGTFYISLTVPAPLTHEEHSKIEVPSGIYKMTFEREYDYFLETISQVQD